MLLLSLLTTFGLFSVINRHIRGVRKLDERLGYGPVEVVGVREASSTHGTVGESVV